MTSQKWCLEVRTSISRAKKRSSMVKMIKNRSFLNQNDTFLPKNDENLCQNISRKALMYWWNEQKVICFNNTENDWKKFKKYHFHVFLYIFTMCMWTKDKTMLIFYMGKIGKYYVKKYVKNRKSSNFQKVLKSSIWLQIKFWIEEKIAIKCLNPNPKLRNKKPRLHPFTISK